MHVGGRAGAVVAGELPLVAADHALVAAAGRRPRLVRAVLAERLVIPACAVEERQQAAPGAAGQCRRVQRVEHGGGDVQRADHPAGASARFDPARPRHDQRHPYRLLVEGVFPEHAVLAKHVAVVGGVDDQRILLQAPGAQRRQDAADHPVHAGDQPPVSGTGALRFRLGGAGQAGVRAPPAQVLRYRLAREPRLPRRRDAVRVVAVVRRPRHVGRVRQHQPHAQAERLGFRVCASPVALPLQESHGGVGHLLVVHLVAALAGARHRQAHVVGAGGAVQRPPVGHRAGAGIVGTVVAHQPLRVAAPLVRSHRVQAPDQHRPAAGRAEGVGHGGDARIEDVAVGPGAVLVRVQAGEHRHPRRPADRRRAVGGVHRHTRRRQPVQVRRLHQRIAVAAGHEGAVLVGENVEQVGAARAPRAVNRRSHRRPSWQLRAVWSASKHRQDEESPVSVTASSPIGWWGGRPAVLRTASRGALRSTVRPGGAGGLSLLPAAGNGRRGRARRRLRHRCPAALGPRVTIAGVPRPRFPD